MFLMKERKARETCGVISDGGEGEFIHMVALRTFHSSITIDQLISRSEWCPRRAVLLARTHFALESAEIQLEFGRLVME